MRLTRPCTTCPTSRSSSAARPPAPPAPRSVISTLQGSRIHLSYPTTLHLFDLYAGGDAAWGARPRRPPRAATPPRCQEHESRAVNSLSSCQTLKPKFLQSACWPPRCRAGARTPAPGIALHSVTGCRHKASPRAARFRHSIAASGSCRHLGHNHAACLLDSPPACARPQPASRERTTHATLAPDTLAGAHRPPSTATTRPCTSRPTGNAAAGSGTKPSARLLSRTRASRSAASATNAPAPLTALIYPATWRHASPATLAVPGGRLPALEPTSCFCTGEGAVLLTAMRGHASTQRCGSVHVLAAS